MNDDFRDMVAALLDAGARFLVVGAHALAVHGIPRATGDLDVWIEAGADNASRVRSALVAFGAPVESLSITAQDFGRPGHVIQVGLPPRRIDLLTGISGVRFEDAWPRRTIRAVGTLEVPFIGRVDLVANKRASGRAKDLADLEALGERPD